VNTVSHDAADAHRDGRPLLILAMDHRDSLARELYGLHQPPTPEQAARIGADKMLVFDGLLTAVSSLTGATAGVLVDEEYGAAVAERARSVAGLDLSMPIEASGQQWFTFAYPEAWMMRATEFAPDHVKVLIRDNPGLPQAQRSTQAARLAEVSRWARGAGTPLIVELLVPATAADLAAVSADRARYDRERRPWLTVHTIEWLQDRGVDPALWKVEGPDTAEAAQAVVETAARGGRQARCIVLGRHAPAADLDRWLAIAAALEGFAGFAIGRSIWWDPLQEHLQRATDAEQVRRQVAENYLHYAAAYLAHRPGRDQRRC
jgi:5-dehydro-2-deoxygluconokinase